MRLGSLATRARKGGGWCVLALGFAVVQTPCASAQGRILATAQGDAVQARAVAKPEGTIALQFVDAQGAVGRELSLDSTVLTVSKLAISPSRQRLVVIGETGGASHLSVVALTSGAIVAASHVLAPAVSPDNRFVAYQVFQPSNAKASVEYAVIDVDETGDAASRVTPRVFYPRDADVHERKSTFSWIARDTVAFLDMSGVKSEVIVAQVGPHAAVQRLAIKPLDVTLLVDDQGIDKGVPPAAALYQPTISRLSGVDGLMLRLKFPSEAALKARRVDVQIW